jgi:hypothetical protein
MQHILSLTIGYFFAAKNGGLPMTLAAFLHSSVFWVFLIIKLPK